MEKHLVLTCEKRAHLAKYSIDGSNLVNKLILLPSLTGTAEKKTAVQLNGPLEF